MINENLTILEELQPFFEFWQSKINTSIIAKVVAVNEKTIDCQPLASSLIDRVVHDLPILVDLPVLTLRGGPSYIAMPITIGDYALVLFSQRSTERWWVGDDNAEPPVRRMHSLSDGVAIVGLLPQSTATAIPTNIVLNGDVLLGGPGATELVAIASKVLTEIQNIVSTFNSHTHVAPGGDTGAPRPLAQAPSSVACSKVKAI